MTRRRPSSSAKSNREGTERRRSPMERALRGVRIVYEDAHVIVVDKPSGLLTIATATEKERTAYAALTEYVRKGQPKSRERVFIVHRLDRDTSGLIVFARDEVSKRRLQDGWTTVSKTYAAALEGVCLEASVTLTSYLVESGPHRVYATRNTAEGKFAQTVVRVVRCDGKRTLVELDLLTGRKHQIRVQVAEIGAPVVGDKVYGKASGDVRLALHALALDFDHPVTGQRMSFRTPMPRRLAQLVGPSVAVGPKQS